MVKNKVESTGDVLKTAAATNIVNYKILFKSISQSNGMNAFKLQLSYIFNILI